MRDVALVTVARSDWGIYRPVLRELAKTPGLAVRVLASGMHLSERFGMTVRLVEEEAAAFGVPVERVPMEMSSDAPVDVAAAMGAGMAGFGRSFAARRPDILLVLGDRFEMFSAVAAAVPFVLPVFHIHGGERTAGAIDDALRHAMTKMSHVHFVSTRDYGRRVRQLGEDSWRIVVSGAPALDELKSLQLMSREELGRRCGLDLTQPYLLVAFHPTTLEAGAVEAQGRALIDALEDVGLSAVFMLPNADPGGTILRNLVVDACERHAGWASVENLAFQEFASLMSHAEAFVGNSSSGIIEAPTLRVPVVNIGRRQEGRVRAANVVDVAPVSAEISAAVRLVTRVEWRSRQVTGVNPYDVGNAAATIGNTLADMPIGDRLLQKGFVDMPLSGARRDPREFCVGGGSTLRDMVRCIDRNRTGMAVVTDALGYLLDVATDGDIRRALLAGETLESSVAVLTAKRQRQGTRPLLGDADAPEGEWLMTMQAHSVRQLPLVRNGIVVGLVTRDDIE